MDKLLGDLLKPLYYQLIIAQDLEEYWLTEYQDTILLHDYSKAMLAFACTAIESSPANLPAVFALASNA